MAALRFHFASEGTGVKSVANLPQAKLAIAAYQAFDIFSSAESLPTIYGETIGQPSSWDQLQRSGTPTFRLCLWCCTLLYFTMSAQELAMAAALQQQQQAGAQPAE